MTRPASHLFPARYYSNPQFLALNSLTDLMPAWLEHVLPAEPEMPEPIAKLAASIEQDGLMEPLITHEDGMVLAGRRRFLALGHLVKQGQVDAEVPVPCYVLAGDDVHS